MKQGKLQILFLNFITKTNLVLFVRCSTNNTPNVAIFDTFIKKNLKFMPKSNALFIIKTQLSSKAAQIQNPQFISFYKIKILHFSTYILVYGLCIITPFRAILKRRGEKWDLCFGIGENEGNISIFFLIYAINQHV